jgi:rubrerythrin
MAKLDIVKPVAIEGEEPGQTKGHTVALVKGEPAAVDGVSPVITVQITDPERDASTLLRAAEELLPIHREAPGIVITDEEDGIEGIVPRTDLEKAVLQMQQREFEALAKGLGLRTAYRPPAGLVVAPFVYWECPQCGHTRVPREGHEDDPPPDCRLHEPPVPMERHVRGGE